MFAPLWRFRSFIAGMVAAEFRNRYTGTAFGPLWAVLSPALMITVYLVVFSQVMQGRLPAAAEVPADGLSFGLFLAIGIICWGSFTEILTRCQTVFIENKALIKKATFPRLALPVIVLLSGLLHFAVILALFYGVLVVSGRWPGPGALAVIPLALGQLTLALALGVLLGTLHVFFRDIGQILPVFLTLWFWMTPIVYSRALLPDWAQPIIAANPLARFFEGYQALVLTGSWQGWTALGPQFGLAGLLLVLAYSAFRTLAPAMADEL